MVYTISTGFAIYFVIWWIVLFLTLPFGVRSQHEDGERLARHRSRRAHRDRDGPQADLDHGDLGGVFRRRDGWPIMPGYLNVERLSRLMGMPF